jgi:hypothetical protein
MGKEFRKKLGYTSKSKYQVFLSSKDIVMPNYTLLEAMNERIISIFSLVNEHLAIPAPINVRDTVINAYTTMRDNNIIEKLNNHGRACEDVYYSWLIGYMAEQVFTPFIKEKLQLTDVKHNGGDDLSNIETFKRTGDADLIDEAKDIRIDVQCGSKDTNFTIKKHKVDHALKNTGTSYAFLVSLVSGKYAFVNLNKLEAADFKPNDRWEGQLCWEAPDDIFADWHG